MEVSLRKIIPLVANQRDKNNNKQNSPSKIPDVQPFLAKAYILEIILEIVEIQKCNSGARTHTAPYIVYPASPRVGIHHALKPSLTSGSSVGLGALLE